MLTFFKALLTELLLKHKKVEYHSHLVKKLEEAEENNPGEYWKLIKMLRENKKENEICNTEDFVVFFENLLSTSADEMGEEYLDMKKFVDNILKTSKANEDFTLEELLTALKFLKNNKSAGPDRIRSLKPFLRLHL